HRQFGYHARFHVAVIVTVLVVAYAIVPSVAQFLTAASGYNPQGYEPKDFARQSWLADRLALLVPGISADVVVNILLFVLVAVVWLALVPPGASRR
ncbi:MAG TPA: hypothetical protein VKD72_39400, partial [Gemmataceae bacterium]|nr:hypothetical protein [Gemmataceae bacterium]